VRIIKLAFISFIVFFVIITGFSLFIPSYIRLSKVVNVGGEKDSIFSLIRNKDQWPRWHPAFTGKNKNETVTALQNMETHLVSQNDSVLQMQWRQGGKKTIHNGWEIHDGGTTDSTALQWYMDFHSSWYPWQKFGSLFYEHNYGRMMEQGLHNIKKEIEKDPGNF
jgi:hypothetical protein